MSEQIDFDKILGEFRADPYSYVDITTRHTGVVRFRVSDGMAVEAPAGTWHHIPGTVLYELNREKNPKLVTSPINGVVSFLRQDLEGRFVEAGEKLLTIRHPLKKREIIERILRKVLHPFPAPEPARYFFSLELQARMDKSGNQKVAVCPGDEILTMSLMKRDTPVYYQGPPGIIHSIYFNPGGSAELGQPLFGVCATEQLPFIERIITRVKAEWE